MIGVYEIFIQFEGVLLEMRVHLCAQGFLCILKSPMLNPWPGLQQLLHFDFLILIY